MFSVPIVKNIGQVATELLNYWWVIDATNFSLPLFQLAICPFLYLKMGRHGLIFGTVRSVNICFSLRLSKLKTNNANFLQCISYMFPPQSTCMSFSCDQRNADG